MIAERRPPGAGRCPVPSRPPGTGAVQVAGKQEARLAEVSVSLSRHHAQWQARPRRTRTLSSFQPEVADQGPGM